MLHYWMLDLTRANFTLVVGLVDDFALIDDFTFVVDLTLVDNFALVDDLAFERDVVRNDVAFIVVSWLGSRCRSFVVGGRPVFTTTDDLWTSPTVVQLTAGSASSCMSFGVLVSLACPWAFGEAHSAIGQDCSFTAMDQSDDFVVFAKSCVECDFGL